MNAFQQARQAYGGPEAPTRTGRQAEHQVFSQVTARLRAAAERAGTGAADFAGVAAVLHDNRRLWTRLAADVADAANGLPGPLRAQIFYLAEFTAHHSRRVLKGEADLQALIDVNTAVMRGLGAPVPAAPVPAAPVPAAPVPAAANAAAPPGATPGAVP